MQLYFVTIHQPFWMAERWSAGLYMYSWGSEGSVEPIRNVVRASMSSFVTFGFGMRRRSIGSGLYFPWSNAAGSVSLFSKKPFKSYHTPRGDFLPSGRIPSLASSVYRAKSNLSIGLL